MFGVRQNRKVRMFIKDGPSIEGVLAGHTKREYVVWAPRIVQNDSGVDPVEVSGHVEIPREQVLWYQVLA
jgi:hypothetical protein